MGCTTGAKILDDGKTIVVFKNKDFKVKNYSDILSLEHSNAFGVHGVNLATQELVGFSIGINQYGLVAVNSNVLATSDYPYDMITKRIVLEARTIDDAIDICEQEIQRTKYQWCNMVIATPEQLAAIELSSSGIATARTEDSIIRTNHHLLLKTNDAVINSFQNDGEKQVKNSKFRFSYAEKILKAASGVEEIYSMLRSHHQEAAICRHGQQNFQDLSFRTVYSYFVTVHPGKRSMIFLDVVKEQPCKASYTQLELRFPLTSNMMKLISERYPF